MTRIKIFNPPYAGGDTTKTNENYLRDYKAFVESELADVPIEKIKPLEIGFDNGGKHCVYCVGFLYEK